MDELVYNYLAGLYCMYLVPSEYQDIEMKRVLEKQGILQTSRRLVVCSKSLDVIESRRMYLSAWFEWFSDKVGIDIVYLVEEWDGSASADKVAEIEEEAVTATNKYIESVNQADEAVVLYSAVFEDSGYSILLYTGAKTSNIFSDDDIAASITTFYNDRVLNSDVYTAYFSYLCVAYIQILMSEGGGLI